jgi:hypothetical protein
MTINNPMANIWKKGCILCRGEERKREREREKGTIGLYFRPRFDSNRYYFGFGFNLK